MECAVSDHRNFMLVVDVVASLSRAGVCILHLALFLSMWWLGRVKETLSLDCTCTFVRGGCIVTFLV